MMSQRSASTGLIPLIFCLLVLTTNLLAAGSSAEAYLHAGSTKYIQGRLQEATVEVEEGLRQYPNDSKLKALAGQLKAMKDQKKQDQGGGGSEGGEKDPDKKDPDKKDEKKEDQEQKKAEEEKKKQEEEAKAQAGKEDKEKQDKGDSTGQAGSPVKPGEMSKEEAERLLNSYQNDEKQEHEQMQRRQKGPVEVEKDW